MSTFGCGLVAGFGPGELPTRDGGDADGDDVEVDVPGEDMDLDAMDDDGDLPEDGPVDDLVTPGEWAVVSAGEEHSCGIDLNGRLYCWGANGLGKLGNGESTLSGESLPVRVGWDVDWLSVSCGYSHTCGLKIEGALYCWGRNQDGELGIGSTVNQNVPAYVEGTEWAQVSAGYNFTCGVRAAGDLFCWGENNRGQLGLGTMDGSNVPANLEGSGWQSVSAGHEHACAVKETGELYCWGENATGELGTGSDTDSNVPVLVVGEHLWSSVSAGYEHTCGVTASGQVYCWGGNSARQLGIGETGMVVAPEPVVNEDTDWVSVAAGRDHTCAVRSGGRIYCWGANFYGQHGDENDAPTSTPSPGATGVTAAPKSLDAGFYHTCAVGTEDHAWCWGYNSYGQMGNGTGGPEPRPLRIAEDHDWQSVAAGTGQTCAITDGRELFCWGRNELGRLGLGDAFDRKAPVQVGAVSSWTMVSAGGDHTCGINTQGLYCWGHNHVGQVGDGSTEMRNEPRPVGETLTWVLVTVGANHTCGLSDGQDLFCWGANSAGQLGLGEGMTALVPTEVEPGVDNWAAVSAGISHTCALTADGRLFCWGENADGQLGTGDTTGSPTPVQVGTASSWDKLSAGNNYTCAVTTGGELHCWGNNYRGKLGLGSVAEVYEPTMVGTETDWVQVSTGMSSTCGLREDGSLYCWGENSRGQVGTGDFSMELRTPQRVGEGVTWSNVSVHENYACAVTRSDELFCWGVNDHGQLGNNEAWSELPVAVALP